MNWVDIAKDRVAWQKVVRGWVRNAMQKEEEDTWANRHAEGNSYDTMRVRTTGAVQ